ncbi:chemotaxis protein CheW [Pseudomonas typographi]|uniref:Purine-binding chemotaxis protein CheW n=1 Tax=Pseudomonas typographi TaxID=2715964 RepID=A0ABR7YYI5_9PSED|nr:chemotaxis protein CheW [Pseudomonas typographi]MBD1550758.1 purine-binding chemotaxis protein CheW [Pseudomonas typographi]MBD1587700.1 purine-binding chemotaxis protein CheW [Pseudomonas typographi]MBD1598223.1 purine-binding chemotaxis protein CheW [Pseudomonas typographi]
MSTQSLATADGEAQYLTFSVAGETYALAIEGIKEIIELGHMTVVPMMPAYVRGVINLRGAVVPVIDLAARFGQPTSTAGRRSCIVILEVRGAEGDTLVFGLLVDAVCAVLDIAAHAMEPAPGFGSRIRVDFIAGMARLDGRFVIVLDVDRVLSLQDLAQMATLAGEAA